MPRDFDLDSDPSRFPTGTTRVGYDADTQQYSYQDTSGQHYVGSQGSRYGRLEPVGRPQTGALPSWNSRAIAEDNRTSWRYFTPVILLAFLFILWIVWPTSNGLKTCNEGSTRYLAKSGDTCWDIAKKYGTTVGDLEKENEWTSNECRSLSVGQVVCVPNVGQ